MRSSVWAAILTVEDAFKRIRRIGGELEMDDCSKLPLLAEALRREGFTEDEVERVFYRNAQRFFEDNL